MTNKRIAACRRFMEQARERNLPSRYRRLMRGLDGDSLRCVTCLLGRIDRVARMPALREGRQRWMDIYTPDEIEAIARRFQEFNSQIIALDSETWAWRGYMLPQPHFDPAVLYYRHQLALLRNPAYVQGKAVIDAGAFIGDSALVLREFTQGPVYSFEPGTENFRALQRTLKLNECRDVFPVNKALGSRSETRILHVSAGGSSLDVQRSTEWQTLDSCPAQQAEVTTLDSFTRGMGTPVGLIKADVEGFEQELLAGAKETISRDRPIMLLSIYHNAHDFFDIKPLIESWDLGYALRISRPPLDDFYRDAILHGETLLICEPEQT